MHSGGMYTYYHNIQTFKRSNEYWCDGYWAAIIVPWKWNKIIENLICNQTVAENAKRHYVDVISGAICAMLPRDDHGEYTEAKCTTPTVVSGVTCTLKCHRGYVVDGDEMKTCGRDGTWSSTNGCIREIWSISSIQNYFRSGREITFTYGRSLFNSIDIRI